MEYPQVTGNFLTYPSNVHKFNSRIHNALENIAFCLQIKMQSLLKVNIPFHSVVYIMMCTSLKKVASMIFFLAYPIFVKWQNWFLLLTNKHKSNCFCHLL